jgi:large subunit ribosomal protein L6
VKVDVASGQVTVSAGPKSLTLPVRPEVKVAFDSAAKQVNISIDPKDAGRAEVRALWGSTRAHIANMVKGVTEGFQRSLEVVGVGYTAVVAGKTLDLKVGYANLIKVPIPMGVEVTVDKQIITVKGADRQAVGQFASVVRSKRKPEPYNGKGIKYTDEVIKKKQGKAFGA